MTLNLFNRNPLKYFFPAILLLVGIALTWRLLLFVPLIIAVIGLFIFARHQFKTFTANHAKNKTKTSSPDVEIINDDSPHPERRILTDVKEY
ncbi:hypothetical protein [Lentilactobacillus kosonis]|uniref:Uncharacterized protein n=1 Tax=Lentilactobacillus kosonis TaxID=2810561 RepID=A0A401FNS8_9LACO|nr:hypothetical protein [Lentilactobacillus kosonis]GAY74003.1 hypothetical protein NBRC111893_2149 [Lentilactobacillus kosonis]